MNIHTQQVPGKSGQNSSETATTDEMVKATKPVRTVADAQWIPAWAAMAYGDGLPPGLMLQTKLTVSQPGDTYEQEADRISQQVMRMPGPQLQRACTCGGACPQCRGEQSDREHERLQMKRVPASDTGQSAAPPIVHEVLRSPDQPLDLEARAFMEPRFGHDFSAVRVHTDEHAARSARTLNAAAFTVGTDIAFAEGRYAPASAEGRALLAHELAHVVQQAAGPRILARQTTEQYETRGHRLDLANLKKSASAGFWKLKIMQDFDLHMDKDTSDRLEVDIEEQEAVLSVVWQMRPQAAIRADITNLITIPKRAGASISKNLAYQITFKPRKSPSDLDIVQVIFVTEGAGATSVVLASSPPTDFTPSFTLSGQFWQTHPEETRRILYWLETQAPRPSFDQILTTSVTSGKTTRSTSFRVKGSKDSQGKISLSSFEFLGDVAPSAKTPPADYKSHALEDPRTGDKIGEIKGVDPGLPPTSHALVIEAIRAYFLGGTRNAEVDAIVQIDGTPNTPRRVLYTFRFKPNTKDPHITDVEVQRIGEEGKEVSLAPQDALALSRVNGFSEHIEGKDEDEKVKKLKKWLKDRYKDVTPVGATITEVEKDVTAKIRAGSSDPRWYEANYDIIIPQGSEKQKEWLKAHVITNEQEELKGLKDFTPTELQMLELTLETMSDKIVKTFKGLRLIRQEIFNEWIGPPEHPKPGHFEEQKDTGGYTLTIGTTRTMLIFDAARSNINALFLGGKGPGGTVAVEPSMAKDFAHELGHTIEKHPGVQKAFDALKEKLVKEKISIEPITWEDAKRREAATKSIESITWYAASDPSKELFAEVFALYYSDPEWLQQNWPDFYNFFDTLDKKGKVTP